MRNVAFISAVIAGFLAGFPANAQYGIPQGVARMEALCAQNPIRCQAIMNGTIYAAPRAWQERRNIGIPYNYQRYYAPPPFQMRTTTPYMVVPQRRYYPFR